jgi:branched-chain amino acid transport system substrate-binding protein
MNRLFAALSALPAILVLTSSSVTLAADSIKIGMVQPLTGPAAESGKYQIQGARLAVEEINKSGGALGRQIELVIEDDQTTNPGAVLAFSKLASDPSIVAFIASIRSTQVQAMSPDIQKYAHPVMIGGTDPALTHSGNPWLFRCRPNDFYSARVIADFGANTLGKKKWAIVHSTDTFGTSGMKNLSAALKAMGIEPVLIQGYTNNSQDFTPVALAVRQSGADILASYMTFETDNGIFARQLRQFGSRLDWIGSASAASVTAVKLGGPALNGVYAVVDFNREANPTAKTFAEKYEAAYKSPADLFGSWAYDAARVLIEGIRNAGSTDPAKIREAILAIKDKPGSEGTYSYDQNGDGLHGYNVVKNENGAIKFIKRVDFNEESASSSVNVTLKGQ